MTLRERVGKLAPARRSGLPPEDVQRLQQRVTHLEALVEGLQDAIHRDSTRHEERMSDLERKIEPESMAKALSDDARRRGL
jgi:hypothetical protein